MLFRFILYSVVAWFVFRWLDGWFSPQKKQRRQKSNTSAAKGGSSSRIRKDVGEYVDYEEVKED